MNIGRLYLWYHEGTLKNRLNTLSKLQLQICKQELQLLLNKNDIHENTIKRLDETLTEVNIILEKKQ